MRIVVDYELCESHAQCVFEAPEVFSVGDDDLLYVADGDLTGELRPKVEAAVRVCPRQALSIEE